MISALSAAIAISAIFAIYFRQASHHPRFSIFKALTTMLIIAMALVINLETQTHYGWVVLCALCLALCGDVLLLKEAWFVYGLGVFLLAHIVFIYAFTCLLGFQVNIPILIVLAFIALLYFKYLQPSLGALAIPVGLYIATIIIMVWQAISLALIGVGAIYSLLGIAALLFAFSDSIIAYDKFKKSFKLAEPLILSTYWAAIYIIALSVKYVA